MVDLVQQTNKMKSQIKKLKDFTDKDVIHCSTNELRAKIKVLLRKQNFPYDNCLQLYWEIYRENFCFFPVKNEYSGIQFYKINGYTIYKAEDILALYAVSEDKLPEEYIVECNTKEESQIAINFIKDKPFTLDNHWKYVINSKNKAEDGVIYDHILTKFSHFSILTFKEFQQKIMKEAKIIGYKCPYSMYNGEVKEGSIFINPLKSTNYSFEGGYHLPKEIVETWEAVLEDEFKVGDWIYVVKDGGNYTSHNLHKKSYRKGEFFKISGFEIKDTRDKLAFTNQGGVLYIEECNSYFRKATQAEIDSLFTKTLTLSNGKEVIIKKGVITAQNKTVSVEDLKALTQWSPQLMLNSWDISLNIESVNIGCWKKVKIADIQLIIKTAEEQIELLK